MKMLNTFENAYTKDLIEERIESRPENKKLPEARGPA